MEACPGGHFVLFSEGGCALSDRNMTLLCQKAVSNLNSNDVHFSCYHSTGS
jgi:hypothetical protein